MWSTKYNGRGAPLPSKQVALFGRQILEVSEYTVHNVELCVDQ